MPADLSLGTRPEPELGTLPPEALEAPGPFLDDVGPEPELSLGMVRGLVAAVGSTASFLLAPNEAPDAWRFTDDELDEICPPLLRMAERSPRLKEILIKGDVIALAAALAQFGARNVRMIRDAKKEAGSEPDEIEAAGGVR